MPDTGRGVISLWTAPRHTDASSLQQNKNRGEPQLGAADCCRQDSSQGLSNGRIPFPLALNSLRDNPVYRPRAL